MRGFTPLDASGRTGELALPLGLAGLGLFLVLTARVATLPLTPDRFALLVNLTVAGYYVAIAGMAIGVLESLRSSGNGPPAR